MILSAVVEHTNMIKIKTPCNAISISKNANGDIVSVSLEMIAAFNLNVINSISLQTVTTPRRKAILLALNEKQKQKYIHTNINNLQHTVA